MMFLILKIFIYLCVALGMGGGAGWLIRHIAAQKEIEALQRNLQDAKTKVPKLESTLRARDERIKSLTSSKAEQEEALKGTRVQDEQVARQLREKDLELQRLKNRLDALQQQAQGDDPLIAGDALLPSAANDDLVAHDAAMAPATAAATGSALNTADDGDSDNALISGLHNEIERLKEEMATTRIQLEVAQSDNSLQQEIDELTDRLRQKAEDYERLRKALQQEQRKVAELERERELQNRSLKVLHQQLEMVRDARS